MSAADAGANAGVGGALPVNHPVAGDFAGGISRFIAAFILVMGFGIFPAAAEQQFPFPGPGGAQLHHGLPGRGGHVCSAEDDEQPECQPAAGRSGSDDELDDAADVRFYLHFGSERTCLVLVYLDPYPGHPAVFHDRMGRAFFFFP